MTSVSGVMNDCPACAGVNPIGARFCGACGVDLGGEVCGSCGATSPVGSRFCNWCGSALEATSPTPIRWPVRAGSVERKRVSVLFADVAGSMELAERLGPERLRTVMAEVARRCAECVTRFEGVVDKFTGDGVMALFGAPIAVEDHARRACYAALEMQRSVAAYAVELREAEGIKLALRVGINSGEVIVGDIDTAGRFAYTAIGHTVGLAQRMEALARPGRVYLTGHAARLAQGYLVLRELGPRRVKGSSRPVEVFELVALGTARGHIDVARGRGLSRFVGREAQLRELGDALEQARVGDGQAVGIVADSGLGKSRLVSEFIRDVRPQGIEVYEAHCQAHTSRVPLVPVLELLRASFGITEDVQPSSARARIEARLLEVDQELASELPLIFELLAVPDPDRPAGSIDPEARRRRLLGLIRRLVPAPTREQVVVYVVEDAQWIDPASDEFLASLVDAAAGARSLVVVTFRPEYSAAWMRRSWCRRMSLSPLPPAVVAGLLGELLGRDPSLDGLADLIAQRTAGNPFFVEEVVRDLVESGTLVGEPGGYRLAGKVRQVAIPDSVQSVLAARIDRLGGRAKQVLAAAAVIGRSFARDLLERVAEIPHAELDAALDAALGRLAEAELIAQTEVYPVAVYAFRHPLTLDVVLGALVSPRRRELHRRAAVAIAELGADRVGEVAALVAQHYEQAELVLDACTWHLTAATWAMANDQPAAVRGLDRVRALDLELPGGAESDGVRANARALLLAMGWRVGSELGHMREIFNESVAAATRAGDDRLLAQARIAFAVCVMNAGGSCDEAAELATDALRSARRSGDAELTATVEAAVLYPYLHAGRVQDALDLAESTLQRTADQPDLDAGFMFESARGTALLWRYLALGCLGRTREALAAMDEADTFLRRRRYKETLSWAAYFKLMTLHTAGVELGDAGVVVALEAYEIAQAIAGSWVMLAAQCSLGAAYLGAGRRADALEIMTDAVALMETAHHGLEALVRPVRSLALTWTGDPLAGMVEAELAIRHCLEYDNRYFRLVSSATFATAAAAAGAELARAIEVLDDAERVVAETGTRGFLPELLFARARVQATMGEHDACRDTLRRGLAVAGENGADSWEKRFGDQLARGTEPITGQYK